MKNVILNYVLAILIVLYFSAIIISVFKKRLSKIAYIIGFPIICINLVSHNIFSGTFLAFYSFVLGFLFYILDVFILNFRMPLEAVLVIFDIKLYKMTASSVVGVVLKSAYEELLWRQTLVTLGGNNCLVIVASLLFSISHLSKKISVRSLLCLLFFSLAESCILFRFGNILNCIVIHSVRNICVLLLQTRIAEIRRNVNETKV